jgi:hypothetical protein
MIATANARPGQDAEFNDWYETIHLAEVCAVPGIKSGRRLRAVPNAFSTSPSQYITIYELDTEHPDQVVQELSRRATSGEMHMSAALEPEGATVYFYQPA